MKQKWQNTRAILSKRAIDLGHAYGKSFAQMDAMEDSDPDYAEVEERTFILGQAHEDVKRVLDEWDEVDALMGEVLKCTT